MTGIHSAAVSAPSGGATHYLDGTGAWSVPAGGGGASLDTTSGDIKALGASASYSASAAHRHDGFLRGHVTPRPGC